jgi:hypothetical protein
MWADKIILPQIAGVTPVGSWISEEDFEPFKLPVGLVNAPGSSPLVGVRLNKTTP